MSRFDKNLSQNVRMWQNICPNGQNRTQKHVKRSTPHFTKHMFPKSDFRRHSLREQTSQLFWQWYFCWRRTTHNYNQQASKCDPAAPPQEQWPKHATNPLTLPCHILPRALLVCLGSKLLSPAPVFHLDFAEHAKPYIGMQRTHSIERSWSLWVCFGTSWRHLLCICCVVIHTIHTTWNRPWAPRSSNTHLLPASDSVVMFV